MKPAEVITTAYHIEAEGITELTEMLSAAGNAAQSVASVGLYEGARVVADGVSKEVRGISTEPFKYAAGGRKRKPSPEEKGALLGAGAAGVAKFKKNGLSVNTSVGFNRAGYAIINGRRGTKARTNYRYDAKTGKVVHASKAGKGTQNVKPIPLIANAINHGTGFMEKQPFFRKAVDRSNSRAQKVIEETAMAFAERMFRTWETRMGRM